MADVPEEFAHLTVGSEPRTSAEAFWMAAQWGNRWSHWNEINTHYSSDRAGEAISTTAQADAADAQRLSAIGTGLAVREVLDSALGGIEDRLSEINDALRSG